LASFPSSNEVNHRIWGSSKVPDVFYWLDDPSSPLVKLFSPKVLFAGKCVVEGKTKKNIEAFHVVLRKRFKFNGNH
jgi:hypothetical protein